jgi:hypothetical protein
MNAQERKIALIIVVYEKPANTSLFLLVADQSSVHSHKQRESTWFRTGEYANSWDYAYGNYFDGNEGSGLLIAKDVFAIFSCKALERLHTTNSGMYIVAKLRNSVVQVHSAYWCSRCCACEPIKDNEYSLDVDPVKDLPNGFFAKILKPAVDIFGREPVRKCFLDDLTKAAIKLRQTIFTDIGVDADYVPSALPRQNKPDKAKSEGLASAMKRGSISQVMLKSLSNTYIRAQLCVRMKSVLLHMSEKIFTPPSMQSAFWSSLSDVFATTNAELAELSGSGIHLAWIQQSRD